MAYFPDLTPHTYVTTDGPTALNVGWLDESRPFPVGPTPPEFDAALGALCQRPILLHRGFHVCQFCRGETRDWHHHPERLAGRAGNGQIRIRDANGIWYAAPKLVHHYVTHHEYRPPEAFVEAVLAPWLVGIDAGWHAELILSRPGCRVTRFV